MCRREKGDIVLFGCGSNLKGSFHVTHCMTSERCLSACADTQTGLPVAIKAELLTDHQTVLGNADARPSRSFLEIYR